MSSVPLAHINLQFCVEKEPIDEELVERAHRLEASIAFALANNKRTLYGCDHTPPPYQENLIATLRRYGEWYEAETFVHFSVRSQEALVEILKIIKWTDTVAFRLDSRPFSALERPVLKRRWLIPSPFDWFDENLDSSEILCYLATHPNLGCDIKSAHMSFPELWSLIEPVILNSQIEIDNFNCSARVFLT